MLGGDLTQLSVLIVDDSSTARSMVRQAVNALGVTRVSECADGVSALDTLASSNSCFDLILSDLNMPNLDGIELLKGVRASERHKATPFVLITAEGDVHQLGDAIRAGLSASIPKPITSEKLQKTINSIAARLKQGSQR